jgi:stalled ribosome alternative rescue factor ArfA
MYPAPSSKSRGSNLKNQWKIYPSSMGAIMGMSTYDSRDLALAKLWQYGAKDFFNICLKEEYGPDAKTVSDYVDELIQTDKGLTSTHKIRGSDVPMKPLETYIGWSTHAKPANYWSRGSNKRNIEKRLTSTISNLTPEAKAVIHDELRMRIYTGSGTRGERDALIRAEQSYKDTIDFWSPQMLKRKYVYKEKISDEKIETDYYSGVISAEVDGYLYEGKVSTDVFNAYMEENQKNKGSKKRKRSRECRDNLIEETKKRKFLGIIEHKQRQAAPFNELPTIEKKQGELVQMNMYMYLKGEEAKQCLWVQTNKFKKKNEAPKQKMILLERDNALIERIKAETIKTVDTLNQLYTDKALRQRLLKTIVWKYGKIQYKKEVLPSEEEMAYTNPPAYVGFNEDDPYGI